MTANLPPEIAGQIHPDRLANERAYWVARDGLLGEYGGLWVGYADGRVVASGRSPVAVLAAAEATGLHPHLACVGREGVPDRVRRESFAYDATYPGEPLPVVRIEFRQAAGVPGLMLDRVIPDTGADVSVLPWTDCQALGLDPSQGQQGQIGGVGGVPRDHPLVPRVGSAGQAGLPLPASGGLRGYRADLGPGCVKPSGRAVPWAGR